MIEKVTALDKIVTDPVLLSTLAKQGIDKDYVEFYQDYAPRKLGKEHSPYAKFYRDLQSGKRFMVVSGLPMVNADGVMVEVGWALKGQTYTSKVNQFTASVSGKKITITCINDQPDGRKKGDSLTYQPQLFINNIEQSCGKPSLLPADPLNSNYAYNTLVWDFGVCKRYLRIIEGSILGRWDFASKPAGEVRIKYNQTGDYRLRLGQFKVSDEEVIKPEDFDRLAELFGYPVTISDSATFYPDAHTESTSVDGYVYHNVADGTTWAAIRGGVGNAFDDGSPETSLWAVITDDETNKWRNIVRAIFLADISPLPSNAVISALTFSLWSRSGGDASGWAGTTNIYSSAPASNIALEAGDYDSLGVAAFCDTPVTYANWVATNAYKDFVFNANPGIVAAQAAADGDGILKIGARNANYDVANTPPSPWSYANHGVSVYYSEQGAGYKPKLVVTYAISIPVADGDLIGIAIIRKS